MYHVQTWQNQPTANGLERGAEAKHHQIASRARLYIPLSLQNTKAQLSRYVAPLTIKGLTCAAAGNGDSCLERFVAAPSPA